MASKEPATSSPHRVNHPRTESVRAAPIVPRKLTSEYVRKTLRQLGITEELFIHEQDYTQFLEEKGITELGRGGEGAVYFLRGHVVKVVDSEFAPAALREVAHMLHLNHILKGGTMGERGRQDWPALLWVYVLSDGSLSIGMKPFDAIDSPRQGSTLYERLNFGPSMEREHALRSIKGIAHSLLYCERQGVIHHDLKPANIYIPGDAQKNPVVFDLGQALWKQSSWGRVWLKHEHNFHYWYNGTFRYMHRQRRLSHMAAVNDARRQPKTALQTRALSSYVPTPYDDVFAYARILRDFVRSKYTYLHPKDRLALRTFYQRVMGIQKQQKRAPAPANHESSTGILRRLASMLNAPASPSVPPPEPGAEVKWASMETVVPEIEKLVAELLQEPGPKSVPPKSNK